MIPPESESVVPLLLAFVGVVWLGKLCVESAVFPPLALLVVAASLWCRRYVWKLRKRGGPIALAPSWVQALLLETRPLDALAAFAVVLDAQKFLGVFVHLLAALRLDEDERAEFVDQLPERIRDFVLTRGLLRVTPKPLQGLLLWKDVVVLPGVVMDEQPGDAPRADPSWDVRRGADLGALTNGFVNDARRRPPHLVADAPAHDHDLPRVELPRVGDELPRVVSSDDDDDDLKSDLFLSDDEKDDDERDDDASLPVEERKKKKKKQKPLLRRRFREMWSSCVETLEATFARTKKKKRKTRLDKAVVVREKSVARAVVEFNPWPTLVGVLSRRTLRWLREKFTVSALSTTALASASALGAALAASPSTRRVAANSARLGAVLAAATALATSVAAGVVLHADSLSNAIADAQTSTFSPKTHPKTTHRWKGTTTRADNTTKAPPPVEKKDDDNAYGEEEDDELLGAGGPPTRNEDDGPPPREKNDERREDLSSFPTAAVIVCGYVVARSCDFRRFYELAHSPFAAEITARLARALLRLRAPFEP